MARSTTKEATKVGETLSGNEVLGEVFAQILREYQVRTIKFPNKIKAEIGDDGDPSSGSRPEYVVYDSVHIVTFAGRDWALGRGMADRDVFVGPYVSDIIALSLDERASSKTHDELAKELGERIQRKGYFYSSLILSRHNGRLAVSERGPFAKQLLLALPEEAEQVVAHGVDWAFPARMPKSGELKEIPGVYEPAMVDHLVNAIMKVLFYESSELRSASHTY